MNHCMKTARPSSLPPSVSVAQRVALWLPFAYLVQTRLHTARLLGGWVVGFVLPVLALAVLGRGDLVALPIALCMVVAVYAAYELGYLVNDALVTRRETHPTERLATGPRVWYAERLRTAAALRFGIGVAALAIAAAWGGTVDPWVLTGWLALWPLFALYNHWRGRVTIVLYLLLNGLRFLLPVWAAAGPQAALPVWPALLLLYALPNTYIAAWKPRYALPVLRRPFAGEARFRLAWHAVVAIGAVACALHGGTAAARHFAMVAVWLLLMRLIALRSR